MCPNERANRPRDFLTVISNWPIAVLARRTVNRIYCRWETAPPYFATGFDGVQIRHREPVPLRGAFLPPFGVHHLVQQEAAADGDGGHVCAIAGAQLLRDSLHMCFHRLLGDPQSHADLAIRSSLRYELDNLDLTLGQGR